MGVQEEQRKERERVVRGLLNQPVRTADPMQHGRLLSGMGCGWVGGWVQPQGGRAALGRGLVRPWNCCGCWVRGTACSACSSAKYDLITQPTYNTRVCMEGEGELTWKWGGEQEAVDVFRGLPPEHYRTGWVQCQVGDGDGDRAVAGPGAGDRDGDGDGAGWVSRYIQGEGHLVYGVCVMADGAGGEGPL